MSLNINDSLFLPSAIQQALIEEHWSGTELASHAGLSLVTVCDNPITDQCREPPLQFRGGK